VPGVVALVPLCDDGLVVCDPVVDCDELVLGLVLWLVPLIPGLALVDPCVEGVVLCGFAVLPVLPVCDDEVVPIWFWSGFEVEVLVLSSSPAVERCALGLLLVWLGNVGGVLDCVDVVVCAKP
jgi:hypothetical protein